MWAFVGVGGGGGPRFCILSPPGYRRAICEPLCHGHAAVGAEPGLGEIGASEWHHPLHCGIATQSSTCPHGQRQSYPTENSHRASQLAHGNTGHAWPYMHMCMVMCQHSCTPGTMIHIFTSTATCTLSHFSHTVHSLCQSQSCHDSHPYTVLCTEYYPHTVTHTQTHMATKSYMHITEV